MFKHYYEAEKQNNRISLKEILIFHFTMRKIDNSEARIFIRAQLYKLYTPKINQMLKQLITFTLSSKILGIPVQFYVATNGNDLGFGTLSSPFKTLTRAQEAVRRSSKANGVIINIREGIYATDGGKPLLSLSILDSGLSEAQTVTWRSYKNEHVLLSGGVAIPYKSFVLSRSSSFIYECDLKALGITSFGSIRSGSLGSCANSGRLELYFNGKPAILARYPNIIDSTDLNRPYLKTGKVLNSLSFDAGASMLSRLQKWKLESDPWLHGYWEYNWADNFLRISKIHGTAIDIDPKTPPIFNTVTSNARYYGVNLLCELDSPGEYYVNKTSGILSFYPPQPLSSSSQIYVSLSDFVIYAADSMSSSNALSYSKSAAAAASMDFQVDRDVTQRRDLS